MHIGEKMNNQKILALIILLTPIVVISLSTLTFYYGYKPDETKNNGVLIVPQIRTDNTNLVDIDGQSFNFVKGKWYLVYFDDLNDLNVSESRYKLATSLNVTLGRKMNRLRRVVIYKDEASFENLNELRTKFPRIEFLFDENSQFEKNVSQQLNNPYVSKSLFLMDDFSNVMEEFYLTLTLNEIFEDLKILL
tara:strand:- start:22613 stop:23188 length:576 start_codon:yes stop_codon:yes gene_type:complete